MMDDPLRDATEVVWAVLALHDRTVVGLGLRPQAEPEFELVAQPGSPYRTAPKRVPVVPSWRRRTADRILSAVEPIVLLAVQTAVQMTFVIMGRYR